MKTLKLSIAQRLELIGFLNSFQGKSFETLTEVWKLIGKIKLTEAEKTAIGLTVVNNMYQWAAGSEADIEVDFTAEEERALVDEFDKRSKEERLGADVYNVAQLVIKLKQDK